MKRVSFYGTSHIEWNVVVIISCFIGIGKHNYITLNAHACWGETVRSYEVSSFRCFFSSILAIKLSKEYTVLACDVSAASALLCIMIACTSLKANGKNDISWKYLSLLSAKFLKLEQLDHDQYLPTEAMGVSMDGTGQVGTYFYTAPEVEQKWPQINEKVRTNYLVFICLKNEQKASSSCEMWLVCPMG